jgi:hypothetical protein
LGGATVRLRACRGADALIRIALLTSHVSCGEVRKSHGGRGAVRTLPRLQRSGFARSRSYTLVRASILGLAHILKCVCRECVCFHLRACAYASPALVPSLELEKESTWAGVVLVPCDETTRSASPRHAWMVRKILRKILLSYVRPSDLTQCVRLSLTPSQVRSSVAVRPRKSDQLYGDRPPPHMAREAGAGRGHGRSGRLRVDSPSPPRRVPRRFGGPSNSSSPLHTRGQRRYHPACQLLSL